MESMSDRLKVARETAGFKTPAEAVARFGWVASTYYGHENKGRGFKIGTAEKYAAAFRNGTTAAWLLTGEGPGPRRSARIVPIGGNQTQNYHSSVKMYPPTKTGGAEFRPEPYPIAGPHDHPIRGAVRDGRAIFMSGGDVFGRIERPTCVSNVADAYTVIMPDNTMEIRYFLGERLHVNPNLPVGINDFVVILTETDPDSPLTYCVRRYVGRDIDVVIGTHYLPEEDDDRISAATVKGVHVIVGSDRQ